MKKGCLIIFILLFITSNATFGQVAWFDGGVVGDVLIDGSNEYQEIFFLTGEPVLLKGTVDLPTIPDSDEYNISYSYTLANTSENITVDRSVTFHVTKTTRDNVSQTLYAKELTSYDETITIGDVELTLGKYSYQEGRLIDNTPAVDYFSGNMTGERTYYIDGDYTDNSGTVDVVIETDPIIGYMHEWGQSETQVVHQEITYDTDAGTWNGVVDVSMASTEQVNFLYQNTDPQSISFRGSYFKVVSEENVLNYEYDLPYTSDGEVDYDSERRNIGESNIRNDVTLSSEALVAPKIRDISSHWAEDEIYLLTSLEIMDPSKEYFSPDSMISRIEFGKAIVNAIEGSLDEFTSTDAYRKLRPGVETPFLDVFPMDEDGNVNEDYNYYEYIAENDIMAGENSYFKPNEPMTRAQAVAIMINALGLQYNAPTPPYETTFNDDANIPEWAKDYIYMANEIGLVSGDTEGNFNPNKELTKAEAAAMINSFIEHIKDDITYDYREKIINR